MTKSVCVFFCVVLLLEEWRIGGGIYLFSLSIISCTCGCGCVCGESSSGREDEKIFNIDYLCLAHDVWQFVSSDAFLENLKILFFNLGLRREE